MSDELARQFDTVVSDAIELLAARVHRPAPDLHRAYDERAFQLLEVDVEHSGSITMTPRTLANLLIPPPTVVSEPAEFYAVAEQRRRERGTGNWPDPETFHRGLAEARQVLAAATKPADEEDEG